MLTGSNSWSRRSQNTGAALLSAPATLDANFQDTGEKGLKNIARPVHVYQWQPDNAAVARGISASNPALPDKPSIAVLPFQNMSGDSEQEYFADGMVEDIHRVVAHQVAVCDRAQL
jgi:adenylate cyclase